MKTKLQLIVAVVLIALTVTTVIAGGDQHHGDKGKGAVNQNQVRNTP